ncbi:hypothetical protein [Singulisphaera sp. PoT]|uniref:hypothetical protein n=1 Tax=Singulisphaera sp. PoT TaxID=3411797 RepID=UPI003BF5484A
MLGLSFESFARKITRLVPAPMQRSGKREHALQSGVGECSGICPKCGEFVSVDLPLDGAGAPCPRCGDPIRSVEPLGS